MAELTKEAYEELTKAFRAEDTRNAQKKEAQQASELAQREKEAFADKTKSLEKNIGGAGTAILTDVWTLASKSTGDPRKRPDMGQVAVNLIKHSVEAILAHDALAEHLKAGKKSHEEGNKTEQKTGPDLTANAVKSGGSGLGLGNKIAAAPSFT